jgi:hypothetical protein
LKYKKKSIKIKKKIDEKRAITPRWVIRFTDLDMLNMFAVSTYHLSLIVFEIKYEKY